MTEYKISTYQRPELLPDTSQRSHEA